MLIAAVTVAGLALLAALGVLEDESPEMEVAITRLRKDRVWKVAYVHGIAEVKRDCDYAGVEFRLVDSGGSVVGTAMANELNLRAGDTWRFEAIGTYTGPPREPRLPAWSVINTRQQRCSRLTQAQPMRKRRKPPLPFVHCLWFLNAEITDENYREIARKLSALAPNWQVVGEPDREGGTPVKRVLFADPQLYETEFILTERPITKRERLPDLLEIERLPGRHTDLARLQNFQAKLRQTLDLLFDGRFSGAALVISQFTKHVGVEFMGYDLKKTKKGWTTDERPLVPFATKPFPDLQIWWQLALSAMRPDWRDYLGRCPIEGCTNRYFLKSRADQKFCSPRHRALYKMRASRGQDPATGQRKRHRELLAD